MTLFYNEFSKIGLMFSFSLLLACFILFLSFRLSIFNPDSEKLSAYECGFDPYEDARNVFDVRFYLVAILFLVFDLEAAFFFSMVYLIKFFKYRSFMGYVGFCCGIVNWFNICLANWSIRMGIKNIFYVIIKN